MADPAIADKIEILHLMEDLGIYSADIGEISQKTGVKVQAALILTDKQIRGVITRFRAR